VELGAPQDNTKSDGLQLQSLEDVEKQQILYTLNHTDWNKSQAAAILQIERSTLDRKIKLYEIKR
jgi:Nif-specific regulatory protein